MCVNHIEAVRSLKMCLKWVVNSIRNKKISLKAKRNEHQTEQNHQFFTFSCCIKKYM